VYPILPTGQPRLNEGSRSWSPCLGLADGVAGEHPLLDRLALDEVLLDEGGDLVGRHAVIPRPLGVDEHGGAVTADAQAADPGAVAGVMARAQVVLPDRALEGLPGRQAFFGGAAVGAGAEQDVALVGADAELVDCCLELFLLVGHESPGSGGSEGRAHRYCRPNGERATGPRGLALYQSQTEDGQRVP